MAIFTQYKTAKGERRYRMRAYIGIDPLTGKKKEITRQGFRTKKEAKNLLNQLKIDFQTGKFQQKDAENRTVNDVYDQWFDSWKETVRESTQYVTEKNYNKHFRNGIGKYCIQKTNAAIIQKTVNDLSKDYKSYQMILKSLRMLFKYAYRMDIIQANPFDKIEYPKGVDYHQKTTTSKFYTKEELINFLSVAKDSVSFQNYARFYLLAYTGMRGGELMALHWEDVDLDKRTIYIHRTLSRKADSASYRVTTPKTPESIRSISISEGCVDILNRLNPQPSGLIFQGKDGKPMQREVIGSSLKYFFKHHPDMKPITPHGFRHTHATLLLEAGANIKQVQQRLGHSDVQTTLDIYTHLSEKSATNTAEIFDSFVQNGGKNGGNF